MRFADLIMKLIEFLWWFVPFEVVHQWELGVLVRLGKTKRGLGPGLRWKVPIIDEIQTSTATWRVTPTAPLTVRLSDESQRTISFGVRWRVRDAKLLWENVHDPESTLVDEVRSAAGILALDAYPEDVTTGFGAAVLSEIADTLDSWGIEVDLVRAIDNCDASVLRLLQAEAYGSDDASEEDE